MVLNSSNYNTWSIYNWLPKLRFQEEWYLHQIIKLGASSGHQILYIYINFKHIEMFNLVLNKEKI